MGEEETPKTIVHEEAAATACLVKTIGGDERTRTADPLLAKQVLYQLSYVPVSTCANLQ
jgi:hypothetical protein